MPEIEIESAQKGPQQAGRFLPQAPRWRKHAVTPKRPRNGAKAQRRQPPAACLSWASSGPIRFCVSSASAMSALARRIRDLECGHFADYTMCSGNSGAQEQRSGEAIERCQPSKVFCGLGRQCIFSLIGGFSQTTELRQVHDDR
jgi:hypothetical protein